MSEQPEERILDKVRKLYERAYHPNTPPAEAETAKTMADSLVMRHAIDMALLDARNKGDRRLPTTRKFEAFGDWQWKEKFTTVIEELGRTYRCRTAIGYGREDSRYATIVGMLEDVDLIEFVYTQIYMGFTSKIDPSWDDNLSFDHNVYNFKVAGYRWPDIYRIATQHNIYLSGPQDSKMIAGYKRHAKVVGDTHQIKTQRHAAYRESFAESFVRTVCRRLEQQRADNEDAAVKGGAVLALVDVNERIDEAFYDLFPHMRPLTPEEREELIRQSRERQRKAQEELEAELAAMTPAQRRKYEEAKERERRKNAKDNERYWRDLERDNDRKYDSAGYTAGKRAGESVDLGGYSGVGGGSTGGEIR